MIVTNDVTYAILSDVTGIVINDVAMGIIRSDFTGLAIIYVIGVVIQDPKHSKSVIPFCRLIDGLQYVK